jgi:hypothetical protein
LFVWAFGVDAGQRVDWILNPPRRSFKLRVLVDRQRPTKNVTLDHTTVLQLDVDGTDSAPDAAADRDLLRNNNPLDLCTIAEQEIRGAQLALDSAEDLSCTIALDVTNDRHVRADTRACSRFWYRRDLFNNRLLLHHPPHDFSPICCRVLFPLGCLAF